MSSLFPNHSLPVPIPGRADLDAYYDNTSRSVPQAPSPEIRAYWSGSPSPINFTNAPLAVGDPLNAQIYNQPPPFGLDPLVARGMWRSPVFDLRPDLKGSGSYQPEARPINRSSDFGRGSRLLLRTSPGFQGAFPTDFKVYCVEMGATSNPRELFALNARQDITAHFFDPILSQQGVPPTEPGLENFYSGASTLGWEPAGNPIRYWAVVVIFEVITGQFIPNGMICQGEML